ncbi:MAG: hypothetical protein MJE63_30455 [Proteobacteria bacterium]|nr:hypothetical protein [Pseudomonadota bacterium]
MSKEVIVERKEVTFYEIIKVGPEFEGFSDQRRMKALNSSYGQYIKIFPGPSIESENFFTELFEQIESYEDLAAIEVSPDLDEKTIRRIVNNDLGVRVIQPKFSGSSFIRYVSYTLSELVETPIDLVNQKEHAV